MISSKLSTLVALPVLFSQNLAHAKCENMMVLLEALPQAESQSGESDRANLFLRCMGGTRALPGTTLLQRVREANGKLCYSDNACGNVHNWSGYVALSGTWIFYKSLFSFLVSKEGDQAIDAGRNSINGQNTGVRVGLEWGQISRDCKPVSPEICI